jgi:hypothetical protein
LQRSQPDDEAPIGIARIASEAFRLGDGGTGGGRRSRTERLHR